MAQKAVVIWDEDDGTEVLVLNASFGIDSLSNFCWIVPIQSDDEPDVRASDTEVFEYLEDMFPVNFMSNWSQYSSSYTYGSSSAGIEVIEIKKIGVYDIAVVWADDEDILTDWLEVNGYDVPNDFEDMIKEYIDEYDECYFIANRINMENEFSAPLDDLEDYNSGIYNDLMADEIDLEGVYDVIDDIEYAIYLDIKANNPYISSSFIGYIMDQDDYEDLMDDWNDDDLTSSELRDEIGEYLVESELFDTIIKLFEGAGTPIEITFSPDDPTYPAYISSLASNFGGIDVYFIGPYQVVDENSILTRWAYAELTSSIESDLEDILDLNIPSDCIYIVHLIYRGDMDDIDDDSVFIKTSQSSGTTPTYPNYPYNPYYPYSSIMPPYYFQTPYSFPTIPSYNFPSPFGSFRPFGGSGFLGSFFGGMGGLYGTSFGGFYGGGYNLPFGGSIFSGFPSSFGGLFGSSFYSGFPGSFGGLFGGSFFPSYSRWPF
ncbi:MAG: DUF2330 domain-containing protein [bacterium]